MADGRAIRCLLQASAALVLAGTVAGARAEVLAAPSAERTALQLDHATPQPVTTELPFEHGAPRHGDALAEPKQFLAHQASVRETHLMQVRHDGVLGEIPSSRREQEEDFLLSDNWWQAVPGIILGVGLCLRLYFNNPLTRKRKYRRNPHEPYGPYRRDK